MGTVHTKQATEDPIVEPASTRSSMLIGHQEALLSPLEN